MGMFDELKIDVPDGFVPKRTWQTKDFDCGLDVYEVRDGQLWRTEWGTHDAQPSMHTGVVCFYAYGDSGEWIEWCAEFHDGKLVDVRKTEEPIRGPGEALRGPGEG